MKDFLEAFTTAEQLKSFLDWEKGLREQIAKEIETQLCHTPSGGCWGVNGEHCDYIRECAAIARGQE